ncbi:MAG: hypothetical protein PHI51_06305, partial [Candidatus Peribacteraceae bacterium]|nr:hypothetical protein [Candidatus Peribacteraceae bacterium]
AVGSLYGYGVNGQLYGSQVSIPTDNASTVSIDAGEFTIGINGPATTQYTSDSNDAVLANVEFSTGGEDIDIKNLYILVHGQTSTGGYMCVNGGSAATAAACDASTTDTVAINSQMEGVELRNKTTGRTVTGVRLTTSAGSGDAAAANPGEFQIYRFDDFVVKGKQTWQFRVDFSSNSGSHPRNGDKFRIYICGEPTHVLDTSNNLTTNSSTCSFGSVITGVTTYQMVVEGLTTGDKVGDVRPRGDIAGNVMEVIDATLTVEVKALATSESAVENAKDINLFRFEAKASSAEDLLFTKAVFEADSGSLVNVNNYALWVDTDGDRVVDTVLENGVATQSSQVTFSEMAGGGYVLPKEQTVVFEVHGDVASSLTGNDLQLSFDTGSTVTYVEAEKLADGTSLSGIKTNGVCSTTCDITVTTAKSTNYTLRAQGDLFVSLDSQTIGARQLLGGTLGEPVLRIKMHAEYEDIDVTDLVLNSSGSTAASVDSLELWLDGATQATAVSGGCGSADVLNRMTSGSANTEASGSGTTAFCFTMDNKQLVVAKGTDVKVTVRPRIKTDVNGATSNNLFALFIDHTAASNDSTGTGSVRARGVASSNNLIANNGNSTANGEVFIGRTAANAANARVVGNVNMTVLSKLASITNGGAATGTVPSGADREIGAFTLTAATNSNSKDGANQWVLSGAIFTVNATNVNMATTGFKIYNKSASMSQNVACTSETTAGTTIVGTASGVFLVDCRGLVGSVVNTAVDSGQSITLTLLANVTNTNTAASSGGSSILQVSLNDFTNITKSVFGQASGESRLQWRDTDNAANQKFQWVEYPDTAVNSTTYRG